MKDWGVRLCALGIISSVSLLTACSKDSSDPNWQQKTFSSIVEVSKSKITSRANGDIFLVWQGTQTQSPVEIDISTINPQVNSLHTHAYQCQRTQIWARSYSASSDEWSEQKQLDAGQWQRTKLVRLEDGVVVSEDLLAGPFNAQVEVSVDASGHAVALWRQLLTDTCNATSTGPSTDARLMYSRVTGASNGWSTAARVYASSTNSVRQPHIVLAGNGKGIATWLQYSPADLQMNLMGASYDKTAGWSTAQQLNDIDTSDASFPVSLAANASQVALRDNGNGLAAWIQYGVKPTPTDPNNAVPFGATADAAILTVRKYHVDSGWEASTIRISGDSLIAEAPSISLTSTGDSWFAWRQLACVEDNRLLRNSLSSSIRIGTVCDGVLTQNNTVQQYERYYAKVMVNSLSSTGVVGTAINVQGDLAETTGRDETEQPVSSISIAANSGGNVLVTWSQLQNVAADGVPFVRPNKWNNEKTRRIWANVFTASAWRGAEIINNGGHLDADTPLATRYSDGSLLAFWRQKNDPRYSEQRFSVQVRQFIPKSVEALATPWQSIQTAGNGWVNDLNLSRHTAVAAWGDQFAISTSRGTLKKD